MSIQAHPLMMDTVHRLQLWLRYARRWTLGLVHCVGLVSLLVLSACTGEDDPTPPTELSYSQPEALSLGDPMPALQPNVTGKVESYAVDPSLPDGVVMDVRTGVISGTPGVAAEAANFTITASNKGGSTSFNLVLTIVPKELTEQASVGSLILDAATDPKKFVATNATLMWQLAGATLPADTAAVRILRNGESVDASVQIKENALVAEGLLVEGRNDLVVLAEDDAGRSLSHKTTLWAGSLTLSVDVKQADGAPALAASVSARLSDDPTVGWDEVAATGSVTLHNVPDRTILLSAKSSGNQAASLTSIGSAGGVEMILLGFDTPSTTINHDFAQGLAEWNATLVGATSLVDHVETIEEASSPSPEALALGVPNRELRASAWAHYREKHDGKKAALQAKPLADEVDQDMQLTTLGEGPSRVTYTFLTKPGTATVGVRYRFVTTEVPGGYFGSEYNDSYAVSIRSLQGGGSAADANSMNGLGLGAFNAQGATGWRTISLPVSQAGDTVQVDLTVTNVSDGQFDSMVIVDHVSEDGLSVTVGSAEVCPNETVTFTAAGGSATTSAWTGGGLPGTGTGASFSTRYATPGDHSGVATTDGKSASAAVHVRESSGAAWVLRFPTSTSTTDLTPEFQASVDGFVSALQAAGADVSIAATYRPAERAYLMHYAYRIAKNGLDPASVPAMGGVDICWVHRDAEGAVDVGAARAAAQQMVNAYGIAHPPALESRHTQRRAIDMGITWTGDLAIAQADDILTTITSTPGTGAGNVDLHAVGAGYAVKKLASDPPHWSDDGH